MLQLSTQTALPNAPSDTLSEPAVGEGGLFAEDLSGEQVLLFLDALTQVEQLPRTDVSQAGDAVDLLAPSSPLVSDTERSVAPSAAEPSAEQWLLSMLDQRAVQVLARDGRPAPTLPVATRAVLDERLGMPAVQASPSGDDISMPAALHESARAASGSPLPVVVSAALPLMATDAGALGAVGEAQTSAASLQTDPLLASVEAGSNESLTSAPLTQPLSSAPRSLKLQGDQAKWGEQMLHALRDTVDMQVQTRMQSTTIRLDPPELGSLEIFLSHESGRLNVQISAAQVDVARLLQHTSERLRHELVAQHFVQVNVQVSSDGQPGQQGRQREPAQALADEPVQLAAALPERSGSGQTASDVLITV